MTVRVAAQKTFLLDKADMKSYVQDVLYHDPLYRRVSEGNNGTYFAAVVQPNVPLVLGADMTVTLHEIDGETIVQVKIESQPFVIGDVFGMYDRYINDFFRKLDQSVKAERHESMVLDDVQFVRPILEGWKLLIVTAVSVIVPLIIVTSLQVSPPVSIPLTGFLVFMVFAITTTMLKAISNRTQSN